MVCSPNLMLGRQLKLSTSLLRPLIPMPRRLMTKSAPITTSSPHTFSVSLSSCKMLMPPLSPFVMKSITFGTGCMNQSVVEIVPNFGWRCFHYHPPHQLPFPNLVLVLHGLPIKMARMAIKRITTPSCQSTIQINAYPFASVPSPNFHCQVLAQPHHLPPELVPPLHHLSFCLNFC